jgi:superfamily II DNA or RNA helicase
MSIDLRPYQAGLVREVYDRINDGFNRIAIIAGTGAGKTIISGKICFDACQQQCRLLFLVHLDVLVGQTYEKMKSFGLPCGFIKSGWPEDRSAPIQIGSAQTMGRRKWWRHWPADIIFYDEAHTTLFSKVGQDLLYKSHAHAIHLAMTATPERLGDDQLGEHLETFVASPPPAELQRQGYLAQMRYFTLPPVDISQVKVKRSGDYSDKGLKNACDRPELVSKIVNEWRRLTPGKRTIAFCVDVGHAHRVAEAFNDAGIPAAAVDGETSVSDRQKLYADLRDERILVLTSCNVISIGFDEPSVEVGLLLRPTQSSALHFQQIGRVMRISPQTDKRYGIILDQAGNLERLGFPEDITDYFLPKRKRKRYKQKAILSEFKHCPCCDMRHPSFVSTCGCGYRWGGEPTVHVDDLVRVYTQDQAHKINDPRILAGLLHQMRQRFFSMGYDIALADQEFLVKTGRKPEPEWYRGSIVGDNPPIELKQRLHQYLKACARTQGRDNNWVLGQLRLELGPTESSLMSTSGSNVV